MSFIEDMDHDGNRTFRCTHCGTVLTFARLTETNIRYDAEKAMGIPEPFAGWGPIADEIRTAGQQAVSKFQSGFLAAHRCEGSR